MTHSHAGPGPGAAHPAPPVASRRLITTLGIAGALAGTLLVFAYQITLPAITANKAARLERAISEVLRGPARWDTLYVVGDALTKRPPEGVRLEGIPHVYLGYDPQGNRVGFAIPAGAAGFQDWIALLIGYDAAANRLLGMKVLENKDTPGLGDKIEKDSAFVSQFRALATPIRGVKQGAARDSATIHMITGATISSRAVIRAINDALARFGPLVRAYRGEAAP